MDIVKGNMGWTEVIVGPMFSGKNEELIRRLRRAKVARQRGDDDALGNFVNRASGSLQFFNRLRQNAMI
ncbi:MAG: hypothetical protein WBD87_09090 [Candidatus Acidiferrales bacterium]